MSISLTRYLVEEQRAKGRIPSELRLLLEVVARACKSISHAVNKGALGSELGDVMGSAGSENVQGEVQKKLDIIAVHVLKWKDGKVIEGRGAIQGDGTTQYDQFWSPV